MSDKPSTAADPWRLVLYSDEVVPGNQLSVSIKRNIWLIYFIFLEMKQLGNEDAWCPLAAIPSIDLKTVNAGISQVFRLLIKSFFGLLTYDMRGGIHLADGTVHTGERVRLFATLSMVLQDGGAQKLVWGCKGDAGTTLCMLCHNLVSKASGIADGGSGLVQ